MQKSDLNWLAGLLEGEGSFLLGPPSRSHLPIIRVEMVDGDVIRRAAELLGVGVVRLPARRKKWKPTFVATTYGKPAVLLMRVLRPLMGERRQKQIDAALACYKVLATPKLNSMKVRAIRRQVKTQTVSAVARRFAVARATVRFVRDGKIYKNVV